MRALVFFTFLLFTSPAYTAEQQQYNPAPTTLEKTPAPVATKENISKDNPSLTNNDLPTEKDALQNKNDDDTKTTSNVWIKKDETAKVKISAPWGWNKFIDKGGYNLNKDYAPRSSAYKDLKSIRKKNSEILSDEKLFDLINKDYDVGTKFRDCPECPEMTIIPAGQFILGGDKFDDSHKVALFKPIAVSTKPITFGEYNLCVQEGDCLKNIYKYSVNDRSFGEIIANPYPPEFPAIYISYTQAKEYAKWLSKKTKTSYRLLSEAEWEYAAKAGQKTTYFWGNDPSRASRFANCANCSDSQMIELLKTGLYEPNQFGLYDMIGNVWEIVEDCWTTKLGRKAYIGTAYTKDRCKTITIKGGSYLDEIKNIYPEARKPLRTYYKNNNTGFRIASDLNYNK